MGSEVPGQHEGYVSQENCSSAIRDEPYSLAIDQGVLKRFPHQHLETTGGACFFECMAELHESTYILHGRTAGALTSATHYKARLNSSFVLSCVRGSCRDPDHVFLLN